MLRPALGRLWPDNVGRTVHMSMTQRQPPCVQFVSDSRLLLGCRAGGAASRRTSPAGHMASTEATPDRWHTACRRACTISSRIRASTSIWHPSKPAYAYPLPRLTRPQHKAHPTLQRSSIAAGRHEDARAVQGPGKGVSPPRHRPAEARRCILRGCKRK